MRPFAEAAFVYEDDDSTFVLGFFLRAGQTFLFPVTDGGFVPFPCPTHRSLTTPTQFPAEDPPYVAGAILHLKAIPDHLGDPIQCP